MRNQTGKKEWDGCVLCLVTGTLNISNMACSIAGWVNQNWLQKAVSRLENDPELPLKVAMSREGTRSLADHHQSYCSPFLKCAIYLSSVIN